MLEFASPVKFDDCSLYMVGHNCAVLPESTDERLFKVFCTYTANVVFAVNGKEYCLGAGEGIIVFPYEKWELISSQPYVLYNYLFFSVDSAKYSDTFGRIQHGFCNENSHKFDDVNIFGVCENICKELESGTKAFSKELTSLLCSQLVVYFLRHFGSSSEDCDNVNNANLRVCSHVMRFIDSRIYSMKSLSEVALEMGYNYSYISTLFRKTCGITLNSYFKTKRMNEAKKLLQDKDMSVSEIARMMNYSSVYAFSKAFKEHFGASPGHYTGRFPNKD